MLFAQSKYAFGLNDAADAFGVRAELLSSICAATPMSKNDLSHGCRKRDAGMAETFLRVTRAMDNLEFRVVRQLRTGVGDDILGE